MIDNNALREKVEKKRDALKKTSELMSQEASSGRTPKTRGLGGEGARRS